MYILNDLPTLTTFFASIYITYKSYFLNYPFFFWSILNSYLSFFYHLSEERNCIKSDVLVSGTSLSYIFYSAWEKEKSFDSLTLLVLSFAFFYLGRSWGNCRPRRNGYTLNHSLFHSLAAFGVGRMINTITN